MKILAKVVTIAREESLKALPKRALRRAGKTCFRRTNAVWFMRDLAMKIDEIRPRINVAVELPGGAKTLTWIRQHGERWMYNQKEVDTGLREGHYFPAVRYGEKIIGYAKVARRRVYVADFKKILALNTGTAFIYDSFVAPEYRGFGVAPYLITEILKFLKAEGIHSVACHIPPWNRASINAYRKTGFIKVNYVRHVRILGLSLFSANPEKVLAQKACKNTTQYRGGKG